MSDATKRRIEVAALAVVFGAGSGWGVFQMRQSQMERDLEALTQTVNAMNRRVTALYCAQIKDPAIREGCNR